MDTLSLEQVADLRGFTVHRSKVRDRCWLVLGGVLFSPRRGHTEPEARALLV